MPRTRKQFDAIREATKERIAAAGLKLFSHKGLAATSIQDIASAAGVSVGLMYHYYKSKEDLFNELVEVTVTSASESIKALFQQEPLSPAEKIKIFSEEVLTDIKRGDSISQYYMLMVLAALAEDIPEKAAKISEEGFAPFDYLAKAILEGQRLGEIKPGDPYEIAMTYFALIQGLAIYKLTLGDRFIAPKVELLTGLLLQ